MSAPKRVNTAEFGSSTKPLYPGGPRSEALVAINPAGKLAVTENGHALGLYRDLETAGLVHVAEHSRELLAGHRRNRMIDGGSQPIFVPVWDVSLTDAGREMRERILAGRAGPQAAEEPPQAAEPEEAPADGHEDIRPPP